MTASNPARVFLLICRPLVWRDLCKMWNSLSLNQSFPVLCLCGFHFTNPIQHKCLFHPLHYRKTYCTCTPLPNLKFHIKKLFVQLILVFSSSFRVFLHLLQGDVKFILLPIHWSLRLSHQIEFPACDGFESSSLYRPLYFVLSIKGVDNTLNRLLLLHYSLKMIIHSNIISRSKVSH